ncbi:MAG: YbaK/EbsC family protein [bacterium]|nr:YbaK/EbsC family protein [bacterium]
MNEPAYQAITKLLDARSVSYVSITHEPCKTSEESEAARAKAGYPGVIGAKAILAKLYFKTNEQFATIVLPGTHVLDKDKLIAGIPELKKMRFATPEEMLKLADLVPGCMPPFAAPIFSNIPLLVIASAFKTLDKVGFNAAYLEKSILLSSKEYLSVVTPSFVIDCSIPKVS